MPNLNPNSTAYVHSYEPNTGDLTLAMDYTSAGEPALRVLSNIQGDIIINGSVSIPGEVTVVNSDEDPLYTHTHLMDENDTEYTASNPFTIDGTVTALQGTTPWTVDGTVELGATSLAALETINIGTMPEIEIKNDTGNPISISKNTTANSVANPLIVGIESDGLQVDLNHGLPIHIVNDPNFLAVSRGQSIVDENLRDAYVVDKSGGTSNLGVSPSTMSTVWDAADDDSLYPWNTFTGTGDNLYFFTLTDDPKLHSAQVYVEGLDSNYNIITETVTLHASDTTTPVATTQDFYRFQQATLVNNNTNLLPHDQSINIHYGSSGGQIVGKIGTPYGKTQQCLYTIPAGYEGFILAINGSSGFQDEITSM